MNLGQILGEQKLRIWQLEDELERKGIRIVSVDRVETERPRSLADSRIHVHEAPSPVSRGGDNRGIGQRVHAAISDHPPGETISEIAAIAGEDISSSSVSAWVHHFDDVVRTGKPRNYRYYRKAAA